MMELDVKNMTCGHCVHAVSGAVKSVDPAANVQVDLERGRVRVEGQRSEGELIAALQLAGYPGVVPGAQAPAAAARRTGCCCV